MDIVLAIQDEALCTAADEAARAAGLRPTSADHWTSGIWVVDGAVDAQAWLGLGIPDTAWLVAVASPEEFDAALAAGADDIVGNGATPDEFVRRFRVAQQQLMARPPSLMRTEAAAAALPGLVCRVDPEGRILWANQEMAYAVGHEPGTLVGRRLRDFAHADDAILADLLVSDLLVDNSERAIVCRFGGPDGSPIWVRWKLSPDPRGTLAVGLDVTHSQEALQRAERMSAATASLLRTSRDAVAVCNLDGTIRQVNSLALRLFGATEAQLIGRPFDSLVLRDGSSGGSSQSLRDRSGQSGDGHGQLCNLSGQPVDGELYATPILGPEGLPSGVLQRIRQPATEELPHFRAQLRGWTHKFNNLLTSVVGNVGLVLLDVPHESPIREPLEDVERAGAEAADLARKLAVLASEVDTVSRPSSNAEHSVPREDDNRPMVLVIDDDAGVRKVASGLLERLGYCVVTAEDGESGLAAFSTHRQRIKLILLDMRMPGINGEQTYERLRRLDAATRVVLMSAHTDAAPLNRMLSRGLSGFIHKPIQLDKLRQAVQAALLVA